MIIVAVTAVRMADKIRSSRIVTHPDWRLLGLVNFA